MKTMLSTKPTTTTTKPRGLAIRSGVRAGVSMDPLPKTGGRY